ncbi:MAG TPA: phage tail sheath C-terminal domain-containing protein [Thermoanaerobaculia bacterium]
MTGATTVSVQEFNLTIALGNTAEEYTGLTLEPILGKYIIDRLKTSALVTAKTTNFPSSPDPDHFPKGKFQLAGGTDGSAPVDNDYRGTGDPGDRTGIKALEDIDAISIIAAPGNIDEDVQGALIEQCERLKDRFAILDSALTADVTTVKTQRNKFDTKYAAIYYPSLRIFDPVSGNTIDCPPSGHMAGIYARVDTERGVHKAPANEIVRGAVDFTRRINKETHDLLNPSPTNINVFRDFRADGRGLRIWGARVMTSDTAWKYINVRRLFLFLEESIDEGTQWVVFEPNDEPLWARVRQSITAFLTRVWRDGALQGATPEEAFFVKCDRTTMTQDDLDNGKLICLVGVAPVKPAEFVIIRISQFTASAEA